MVGVAVKVTLVPEQIVVIPEMVTTGVAAVVTVIVIALDVAVDDVTQV